MMRRTMLLVAGVTLVFPLQTLAQAQATCDRACLTNALNQYLGAVVKKDPAAAPLFVGFRQTENATVVLPGSGVWKSVTALGSVQRRFIDTVSGQAGFFGILEEGAGRAVATLRLRVQDRRITEAEWVIGRPGAFGPNGPGGNLFDADSLVANPPPERIAATASRASRATLLAIANSYFDGLTTHDGSVIAHHPGCTRVENGTVVTGRAGRGGAPPGDCSSGLETINIAMVAGRRYPIVDEEAQAVLGMVVFMRNPGSAMRRNLLTEWFYIDDNRIRTIYAAMYYPPPEQGVPNWPPYEGHWPIAALPAPQPPR